jgi:hypothetical protein
MLRDRPEFQRGCRGEQLVLRIYQRGGYSIVPIFDCSGRGDSHAPRLLGRDVCHALPDMCVIGGGENEPAIFFSEVKTKKAPTLYRYLGQHEHGFGRRLFEGYLDISRRSGCRIELWIVETESGAVLWGDLGEMPEPRVYTGEFMDRGGTVFWPVEAFTLITNWHGDPELAAIMHGQKEAQA